jgi:hypothetical protein
MIMTQPDDGYTLAKTHSWFPWKLNSCVTQNSFVLLIKLCYSIHGSVRFYMKLKKNKYRTIHLKSYTNVYVYLPH